MVGNLLKTTDKTLMRTHLERYKWAEHNYLASKKCPFCRI